MHGQGVRTARVQARLAGSGGQCWSFPEYPSDSGSGCSLRRHCCWHTHHLGGPCSGGTPTLSHHHCPLFAPCLLTQGCCPCHLPQHLRFSPRPPWHRSAPSPHALCPSLDPFGCSHSHVVSCLCPAVLFYVPCSVRQAWDPQGLGSAPQVQGLDTWSDQVRGAGSACTAGKCVSPAAPGPQDHGTGRSGSAWLQETVTLQLTSGLRSYGVRTPGQSASILPAQTLRLFTTRLVLHI